MSRLIDADKAVARIDAKLNELPTFTESEYGIPGYRNACVAFKRMLDSLPTVNQWSPFKTRPLTEEEKEDHPEWDCILDCRLPDDGQAILVSINVIGHEKVQYDEFFTDDGSYLDSGYEIGTEAIAWMPLPKPYKAEREEI